MVHGLVEIERYLRNPRTAQPKHVIIASLSGQPDLKPDPELELILTKALRAIAHDRGFALYPLGPLDWFFFSLGAKTRTYGSVMDIRSAVVGCLSDMGSPALANLDKSRLIQSYDLSVTNESPLGIVEAHADRLGMRANAPPPRERLSHKHIALFEDAWARIGTGDLIRRVVRQQKAYIAQGERSFRPVYSEFYCSMDAVRREVIGSVELRQNRHVFALLTASLDRLLLEGFAFLNGGRERCAINLNVESVFGPEFENFLRARGDLSHMVFEFRPADILHNLKDFSAVRDLLTERGAIIAVDGMFPDMFGLLRLEGLGVKIAKLFAPEADAAEIVRHRAEIAALQQSGVMVILARTHDERLLKAGLQAGVRIFQGFHLDRMTGEGPGALRES